MSVWRGQGDHTSGDMTGTTALATLTFASPWGKSCFPRCVEVRFTCGALHKFQVCSLYVEYACDSEIRVHTQE